MNEIVLCCFQNIGEMMQFGDEDAAIFQQADHAPHQFAEPGDVREHVRCGDRGCLSVIGYDIPRKTFAEESLNCLDAVDICDLRDICRLRPPARASSAP